MNSSNDLRAEKKILKWKPKVSRKKGRIILVGVTGLDINREWFYKKELSFQVSCSYGPDRYDKNYQTSKKEYPQGLVRWTTKRNFESIYRLLILSMNYLKKNYFWFFFER